VKFLLGWDARDVPEVAAKSFVELDEEIFVG